MKVAFQLNILPTALAIRMSVRLYIMYHLDQLTFDLDRLHVNES